MTSPPIAPRAAVRADVRRALVPVIPYPAELPVSQVKDEIAAAIRDHQVVIVAGETGSGKTTQLPKICLELGRGVTGQIGQTQPRRIAARSVAERIAAELGTELGAAVGYQVRFTDTSSDGTLIKVMTDGILLTEMQRDRQLRRYDTLIIDEAHERSLNIDFILGYLKRLLPRRPDLKVIITSATIDPDRFAAHFAGGESGQPSAAGEPGQPSADFAVPVLEVSGRTYPVEVRYRPLADPDDPGHEPKDQVQGILDAVAELRAEGPGDILVFLSGEREIRDTADALAGQEDLDVLPLYARLSAAEQHRVFEPHRFSQSRAGRRVVLATNVAETSLTVPGIHYVIDPGTARISRYSHRTKVQRLPIERISQASAHQRAGRCGRTAAGVCIRLYTEEDFAARPAFTDPEILRTNLASVILRMAALDLGDMADFPFVDPPDSRNIADGVRLLGELGAFAASRGGGPSRKLTDVGRKLARLPADPRLGRMILAAGQHGCAREVLIITAALSIVDPRERPTETRQAADAMHARFAVPGSDFLAFLALWNYLRDRQRELSASAFRRMCRREYLHYLRVREWQDVYGQLRQAAAEVGVVIGRDRREPRPAGPEPADRFPAELADRVHMSLLAGLLSHIGMQDAMAAQRGKRRGPTEFSGARGVRFAIFPDSVLARKPPSWVVAAELVETSRLWARVTARIDPAWAEPLAGHLVKRSYSEPRWDARRGAVLATEKVSLYGLPIVPARTVNYARIDPAAARELFIARALVDGDWETHHRFFARNQQVLDEAASLEQKARRRGIVADDTVLFDFYDRRVPGSVTSARHFDSWWKKARAGSPDLLDLTLADLVGPAAGDIGPADYPERWGELPLSYEFAPGAPDDGVTVDIPLARLNQVDGTEFGWQVPGLREEMVTELIRTLPKPLRTRFVPAPDTARTILPQLGAPHGDLLDRLSAELGRLGGTPVPPSAFDESRLPAHLRITFRVVEDGQVLASGKDLAGLRRQLRPRLQATLSEAARGLTRSGLRTWDLDSLPRVFAHGQVRAYPALADAGDAVDIRLFETETEADAAMLGGTRRLLLLQVPSGARAVASRLPVSAKLALSRHPYRGTDALLDDCAAAAADQIILDAGGPAWGAAGFAGLLEVARERLAAVTADVVSQVARVLAEAHAAEASLAATPAPALAAAFADMRSQLAALVHPGFVTEAGARRLADVVRYLQAISRRLDKLPEAPARDAERMAAVHRVADDYASVLAGLPPSRRRSPDAQAVRWMIEEFRVSLFAQLLGTRGPVSEQRIERSLDRLGQAPAASQAGR
ncbi:MAG TPA: ATP-dependent RNA helicase HrpA [Streptosporangiaceae bacterium]|nr:ATP-dependent RNA helicase HrpA [Streptosporangiaceae bacterium]